MKQLLILLVGCMLLPASCKKQDSQPILTPGEKLVGTWKIDNTNFLASDFPGDGSYLQFNACATQCNGTDYKASDTTTGSFTYVLNGESSIAIADTMSEGGNFNSTWDVLTLTDTRLRITAEFLGSPMIIEMNKQ